MFTGYNLKLNESFFDDKVLDFDEYKEIGEKHLKNKINRYKSNLEKYVKTGTINGSKLQNDIFPTVDADIFISHSHKDKDLANALAGWINEKFRLKVFIDSNVWGYAQELLEDINSVYSNKRENDNGGYTYNYQDCNNASQHVNMMLSVALQKMIDKVECIILLNTDNSISVFDEQNKKIDATYSPWIYSEIVCTQIVRKKPLLYYREYNELSHAQEGVLFEQALNKLMVSYNISLQHLTDLCEEDLEKWITAYEEDLYGNYNKYSLDALYSFKHPNEFKRAKEASCYLSYESLNRLKAIVDGRCDHNSIVYLFEHEIYESNCAICQGRKCEYRYEGMKRQ